MSPRREPLPQRRRRALRGHEPDERLAPAPEKAEHLVDPLSLVLGPAHPVHLARPGMLEQRTQREQPVVAGDVARPRSAGTSPPRPRASLESAIVRFRAREGVMRDKGAAG